MKRYKSIYSTRHRRRGSPVIVIVTLLVCALLVFVGWSIAGPLQKLFTGQLTFSQNTSSAVSSGTSSSIKQQTASQSSSSAPVSESTALHAVYLPGSYISDNSSLDQVIAECKAAGINSVIIDLKDDAGKLYFASPTAAALRLVSSATAPDAAAVAARLKAAGIEPAARICCFKDDAAARAMREAAVKYKGNHSWLWLDATNKAWLNPYSDQAVQYLSSLAKEAVGMGYKKIFLDDVQFPASNKSNWFGSSTMTKQQALAGFVSTVTRTVSQAGGKTSVIMPGEASIGNGSTMEGQDQSIYSYGSDLTSPMLCPSLLGGNSVTIGSGSISKPDLTPGDTVSAAAAYLKGLASGSQLAATVPFIQAYTNTNLYGGNKKYTADDINAEISALKSNGVTSYVLYSPTGSYDLSGINLK